LEDRPRPVLHTTSGFYVHYVSGDPMTPLTAEKIAELEGWPAQLRKDEAYSRSCGDMHDADMIGSFADELERLIAPFLSLAKRVAGAPVVQAVAHNEGGG
jgi:hypothetical protein